jgi:hypothetical protein
MTERWIMDQSRGVLRLETAESFVDTAASICRAVLHDVTRRDIVVTLEECFQMIEIHPDVLRSRENQGMISVQADPRDNSLVVTPTPFGEDELRKWHYICDHGGVTRTMASSEEIGGDLLIVGYIPAMDEAPASSETEGSDDGQIA